MRAVLVLFLALATSARGSSHDEFLAAARERHGTPGEEAARFLIEHMPEADREALSAEFLIENLDLAFRARERFPWAASVPVELFHNDVLPYAVFDEPRDPWRAQFYELAGELVKEATTATEAVQTLNRELFNRINVHYHTGRKRANQSPKESIEISRATCTGLSIILVGACRAVGIPARAVGTPMWTNLRGNHTWVEVWDGDWHFTGADEYDASGLNRGWFTGDASKAKADEPRHAIYATSWKREGLSFPMVWSRRQSSVAAVNVTARYTSPRAGASPESAGAMLGVRLFDRPGGTRIVARVCAVEPAGGVVAEAETKAGTADMNDMARLGLEPGLRGTLRFAVGDEIRELPFGPLEKGEPTIDAVWANLRPASPAIDAIEAWLALPFSERPSDLPAMQASLSKAEAARCLELLFADRTARVAEEMRNAMSEKIIGDGTRELRWLDKTFGDAPTDGRSLWISMHGGGNTRPAVNDRQWRNQIDLYEPAEGIYLAPRAPTDTWNLWHEAHIDSLFQSLIDAHVALAGVNPNRVFLLGYSAGGDGVWQLAPRMADRFAAAAMMAGHPNEASVLGLRNLPFAVFVGGNDSAYGRNTVVAERAAQLGRLAEADPGAYIHMARVYEGIGHWMQKKDAEALPWMATFTRQPWPKKIVWEQDDVVHRRFYWLQIPPETPIEGRPRIEAVCDGQSIALSGEVPGTLRLRLSDALLDLDRPVTVTVNGTEVFAGKADRTAAAIAESLEERLDAASAATAILRWN
ncbi:MAG: hypothetical protein KF833_16550 [Verrucomicrobiae bacterium]|nr:hypothetical protein [Verrucomicrobiae bacterium]